MLCQTFPGAPAESLAPIRTTVHAGGLFEVLYQERSAGDLVGFALQGAPFTAGEPMELRFECACGPERALSVLSTLGADDLEDLADEAGPTEVRCSFCGAAYNVDAPALRELAQQLRGQRS